MSTNAAETDDETHVIAGRDWTGNVTGESVGLVEVNAGRTASGTVDVPDAEVTLLAGGWDVIPGLIDGAIVRAKLVRSIKALSGAGRTGDEAGNISGLRVDAGAGGIDLIRADGAISGVDIDSAADIGEIEAGYDNEGDLSGTIAADGDIGSVWSRRGGIDATISGEHIGALKTGDGALGGSVTARDGIGEIYVAGNLSAAIRVTSGDLGTLGAGVDYETIRVEDAITGTLTVAQGNLARLVAGLHGGGGISGDLSAKNGVIEGIRSYGSAPYPFGNRIDPARPNPNFTAEDVVSDTAEPPAAPTPPWTPSRSKRRRDLRQPNRRTHRPRSRPWAISPARSAPIAASVRSRPPGTSTPPAMSRSDSAGLMFTRGGDINGDFTVRDSVTALALRGIDVNINSDGYVDLAGWASVDATVRTPGSVNVWSAGNGSVDVNGGDSKPAANFVARFLGDLEAQCGVGTVDLVSLGHLTIRKGGDRSRQRARRPGGDFP